MYISKAQEKQNTVTYNCITCWWCISNWQMYRYILTYTSVNIQDTQISMMRYLNKELPMV